MRQVPKSIRVLIIGGSSVASQMLSGILDGAPDIAVAGTSADPLGVPGSIAALRPGVLVLDAALPDIDGTGLMSSLMRSYPLPVVVLAPPTEQGAQLTLAALEQGAVDCVPVPIDDSPGAAEQFAGELLAAVRIAAAARVRARERAPAAPPPASATRRDRRSSEQLIAIAASTGGVEAIREVLSALPADGPAVLVAQRLPAALGGAFARRMDTWCAMTVCEPRDGQQIVPGTVYVAPGDRQLTVERDGARYRCRLQDAPPVGGRRPSVDVLFRSVAQQVGSGAVGAILTGVGDDGARGLRAMRDAGASTVVQNEASSVLWGMPGAAVRIGAAGDVIPLDRIGAALLRLATIADAPAYAGAQRR